MRTLTIFMLLFFGGCTSETCYHNHYQTITDYEITINAITPNGVNVDDSGFFVDLSEIDRQIDEMEICVQQALLGGIDIETARVQDCRAGGQEYRTNFSDISVERDCLIVKVAPDWRVSNCSEEYMEIFPCDINPQVCEDKGLEVTDGCPCQCRSIIQDENVIVTTPDLYLFRGELARMITGCNNPWFGNVSGCLVD